MYSTPDHNLQSIQLTSGVSTISFMYFGKEISYFVDSVLTIKYGKRTSKVLVLNESRSCINLSFSHP